MYTSGTTGKPKGAIRGHRVMALLALMTALEHGFMRRDTGLLVMPLGHANSLYFFSAFAYIGGTSHEWCMRSAGILIRSYASSRRCPARRVYAPPPLSRHSTS